ncbi:substrate-binding domain-containing protein [Robiginitalea sp. SC105]|uniref:substrate-binding domain-containing protein n=1 Tax=Robiginitalea sp. SC105 TaxID=2762332 RepID=UPI001639E6D8|nr:substrate-binding domain-containing protein [Robiginitalea sp. SC105]MBC2840508.1 ABC transporter substrate-binding protein [Robiginitalea sp. SC105]
MSEPIRIAGVPEHFNLPWHLALQEGAFAERGIDLEWTDIPQGTGKMCDMLRTGSADMALLLTEGFVKAAAEGLDAVIVQEFVASPLHWGIHVAQNSRFREVGELASARAAISRYGSGSHLMAFVNAKNRGWDTGMLRFEVVDTLEGAVSALTAGEADYFMWERFTTQPLVDSGVFRRLGICPTPWPCFILVAGRAFAAENAGILNHILEVINTFTVEFKSIPSIDRTLALRYGQQLDDIRSWLSVTEWSQDQINIQVIENVVDTLFDLKLISNKPAASQLLR